MGAGRDCILMMTVAIGMLGAGFIGQMHSLTFGSVKYSKHEPRLSGRLVVLAETDRVLAQEAQRRYGWEVVVEDWRAAVDNRDVELFINSGPNDAHAEPTMRAASAGKHLFCEKPLARSA